MLTRIINHPSCQFTQCTAFNTQNTVIEILVSYEQETVNQNYFIKMFIDPILNSYLILLFYVPFENSITVQTHLVDR